jgi:uncharacterized protein with WD repeat
LRAADDKERMGHQAQTQKLRTKRPDGRAIAAKSRKAMEAKLAGHQKIQDLRVTTKQKGERLQRETSPAVNGEFASAKARKTPGEKLIHALRKKLKQIEELLKKQEAGQQLDDAQLDKIASVEDVIAQLEEASSAEAKEKGAR